MTSIKILTKQEYEKNGKTPSEIVFYETEKDICRIVSLHLSKNIKENMAILQKFIHLQNEDVYEVVTEERVLYILKPDVSCKV